MRNLKIHKTTTPNSLSKWYKIKNPLKVILNFITIYTARYCPSLALKRALLRTTGMKIGKNTSIGLSATFDIFFPELIEIGENCLIGYNTTILAHEFLISEYRTGEVKIGSNVMIGANTTILAGTTIGDNAQISAMTLVNKDIKKNELVGGIPLRQLK
ncbi:MAG: acyltransferase [archaeon]|nr:acyltransferase [archaeon]